MCLSACAGKTPMEIGIQQMLSNESAPVTQQVAPDGTVQAVMVPSNAAAASRASKAEAFHQTFWN
jgi:hypothetical protein